ncbi:MAG TPA: Gfo/Idh/MocA family oxidoreductase [Terracidiphilus sp.]
MDLETQQGDPIRILVIGCGNMGAAHGRAYRSIPGVEIAGLVSRGPSKHRLAGSLALNVPLFEDVDVALARTSPDAVCIATYPDTHEQFSLAAIAAGCDLFVEKPLAPSTEAARRIISAAQKAGRQLVVGHILRHHPTWQKFIAIAQTLGRPLAMRMNLNQQSSGDAWRVHRSLLESASPIVDCGVHYVDVMCQMVSSKPLRVSAIGACLAPGLPSGRCNYGQLQIAFEDGSVGWYESGWGPMMSETAYFVKDVIGPLGAVSIQSIHPEGKGASADVESHVRSNAIRIHRAELDASGKFVHADEWLELPDEPDHDALCLRQQEFFVRAIRKRLDLSSHISGTFASLAIVLAAEEAMLTGRPVDLSGVSGLSGLPGLSGVDLYLPAYPAQPA